MCNAVNMVLLAVQYVISLTYIRETCSLTDATLASIFPNHGLKLNRHGKCFPCLQSLFPFFRDTQFSSDYQAFGFLLFLCVFVCLLYMQFCHHH